jgi:hypothetical protein
VPSAARIDARAGAGPSRRLTASPSRRPGSRSDGFHATPAEDPDPPTGNETVPRNTPNVAVRTATGTDT